MIELYKIIPAIIIGIIEGITEFLPISSTGHMIIVCHWLQLENNNTKILKIFIQFGSTLAILCFFYKKVIKIINFKNFINSKKITIIHIFFSTIPTVFIGFIFYKKIKTLFNVNHVMYALIIGSFFLIISELLKPKKFKIFHINDISLYQSIIIGLSQIFCLYPGYSRSGSTIATGILLGIKKSVAIEFSFIISIPLQIGASLLDLINNISCLKMIDFPVLFTSFMISFIISIIFIKMLLKIINKISLIYFGIYRLFMAGLIYLTN